MPDGWRQTTIGDVVTLQRGFDITRTEQRPGEVPVVSSGGVSSWHDRAMVKGPGVVIGRKGTLGHTYYLATNYWPHDTTLWVRDFKGNDPRFVYYFFSALKVLQLDVGSANPTLNRNHVHPIRTLWPPVEEQRRIVGVLGALDDLIDSNRAQVASLTSLVQAEFECRFATRGLGLTIADVATVVDCLHSKKPERASAGGVLLQLNNILDSGLLDLAQTYLIEHDVYVRWTRNLETQQWDCVITNVGRVGAVARIPANVSAALGRNMTAVRPKLPSQDGAFLLAALLSRAVRQEIELRTDAGTILNALNVRSIPTLRLQSASRSERESFQAFAAPLLTLADSLHGESISLSRQRNELLPMLLSGRVRVEDVAA